MPAPEKNNYAAKPASKKTSAGRVPAAFTPPEKKRVMKAHAGKGSLSRFVALAALAAIDNGLEVHETISAS
jgi:hypothetical protein